MSRTVVQVMPSADRAGPRDTDGLVVARRVLMMFVLLDLTTSWLAQWAGYDNAAPLSARPMVLESAAVLACAAVLWHRVRMAAVLTAVVVVLALFHPSGMEIWLLLVISVVTAVRGRRWQVVAATAGCLGFGIVRSVMTWRQEPGHPLAYYPAEIYIGLGGLAVGLAARHLLRERNRRHERAEWIAHETAQIRAVERIRLADDLQTVVTRGLAGMVDDVNPVSGGIAPGVDQLRAGLESLDRRSREVLAELRTLLEVLRREASGPEPASGAAPDRPRWWLVLVNGRAGRIAAAAAAAALTVVAVVTHLGSLTDPGALVAIVGLVAVVLATWRPVVGIGLAIVVLTGSLVLASGAWDWIPAGLICLLVAARVGSRRAPLVMGGLLVYGVVRMVLAGDQALIGVIEVAYVGVLGLLVGLAAHQFWVSRVAGLDRLAELEDQRSRSQTDQRAEVARELHDVVAHQLSVMSMLIMATSTSDDPVALTTTWIRVQRCVRTAQAELTTLMHTMRGAAADRVSASPLLTPTGCAAALAEQLSEQGYRSKVRLDPRADALDVTSQRTLACCRSR